MQGALFDFNESNDAQGLQWDNSVGNEIIVMLVKEANGAKNSLSKFTAILALEIFNKERKRKQKRNHSNPQGSATDQRKADQDHIKSLIKECKRIGIDPYMLTEKWMKKVVRTKVRKFFSAFFGIGRKKQSNTGGV